MRSSTSAKCGSSRSSQFPRATHRAGGARGRVRERPHLLVREPRTGRAGVGHAIRRERGAARGPHPPDGPRPPGARALRRVARGGGARRSRQLAPDRRAGRAADRRAAAEHARARRLRASALRRRGYPHRRRPGAAPRARGRPRAEPAERGRPGRPGVLARHRAHPRVRRVAPRAAVRGCDRRGLRFARRPARAPRPPGRRAGHDDPADHRALRALVHDRGARRGLHPQGDVQGPPPADGHHPACAPERAHPGGERDRRPRPAPARRDGGDGGGLRLARDGAVGARGGAGARLPARHRPHRRRRGDRGRREPRRRPRVHADRPADPPDVSRLGVAALAILVAVAALALAGPFLWTIPPEATDPAHGLAGLSAAPPPGTDELGRDVLSRLLHGSRVTPLVGVAAMLAALLIGVVVRAIAGYRGGWLDAVLMRFTDAMLAVPAFFFILVVITVSGTGLATLVLVIGGLSWMPVARVVYGETLRWKTAEFVIAAASLGVPAPRLLARHILPQAIPSLVVSATLGVAFAILTESALSYLGLGVQPPLPSWGNMLQRAQQYVFTAPALAIYPGLAITVVVLAFNFLGDGLRDALDPQRRR